MLKLIYFIIIKLIGITTKLIFKTDKTKYLRDEFIKEMIENLAGKRELLK